MSGEHVGALAMSEPGAGSDVMGMRTRAEQARRRLRAQRQQDVDHERPDADVAVVYATSIRSSARKA